MSDAYKGLTIRIGADTTSLQSALKAASSAASETQKHLRLLEKAAKLDPSNTKAISLQFGEIGDKASALAKKARTLQQAINGLSAEGIDRVAARTKDAAYEAEKATERYAAVVSKIKQYKNEIASKYSPGFDIGDSSTDPFKGIEIGSKAAIGKMRELKATEAEVAEYTKMVAEYFERLGDVKATSKVREFKELEARLASVRSEASSATAKFVELATVHPTATLTKEFAEAEQRIRRLEAVASDTTARMSALNQAFDLDRTSVDVATQRLLAMKQASENLRGKIAQVDAELELLKSGGFDKVAAQVGDLDGALAKAQGRVIALRTQIDKMEAGKAFGQSAGHVEALRARLREAEAEMDRLANAAKYASKSADFAVMVAQLRALESEIGGAANRFGQLRGMLQNLGWSMTSTVSAGMMMFAHRAVSAAEEVDAAYRNMRKTVQGTEEQFEGLKKAAIEYSRTHVTSAEDLLNIEAMGGQLGVATSKLEEFAQVVSNLSIATDLDADTAAQQLGQLSGILNDMSQDDFAKYGDALTRLGNNNATLESKISDVMLRISSMGTITGFTTPQLLAWSTAVAATGQGAEAAGTAISKTMSNIESAVGAGGDKLAAFASVANMSAAEFAQAWKDTPSDAMKAFIEGLKGIEENGGSADATLGKLGITSVRQKQAILGLMQTIDGLSSNIEMSQDAWDGVSDVWGDAGDAAREAERKAEGFSGAIQLMRNNFEALGLEVGSSIQPAIEALSHMIEAMTKAFSDSPQAVKGLVSALIALFALLGPGLVSITALINGWETMKKSIKETKAWKSAEAAVEASAAAAKQAAQESAAAGVAAEASGKKAKAGSVGWLALKKSLESLSTSLGVAGIAVLIGMVVGKLSEYAEACSKSAEATGGMRNALEGIKSNAGSVAASYEESAESVLNAANSARDAQAELANSISSSFSEFEGSKSLLDDYVSTISELAGNCEGSAEKQRKLKIAVDGYNQITGDTVRVIDLASGALSSQTSEIEANAAAWEENAKKQALQEAYADALKQQQANKAALAATDAKLANQEKGVGLYLGDFAVFATKAGVETHDLENARKQLADQDETNTEMLNYLSEEMLAYSQAASDSESATDSASSASERYASALGMTSDEFNTLSENTQSAIDSNSGLKDFFESTGMTVDEFAYTPQNAGTSATELGNEIDSMKSKVQNAFDQISESATVSAEDMIANLQHNIDVTNSWSANLSALYARAGDGAGKALVDSIAARGPEYASTVAALLNADDATWAALVAKWEESGAAAVNGATAGVRAAAPGLAGAASESGAATGQAFAQGVSSTSGDAAAAGSDVASASSEEIQNKKDTAWNIGAATGSNYAVGVWSKMGEASEAGDDVASSAASALSNYSDTAYQWGAHLGSNFAAGLWSKMGEAAAAGSDVSEAAGGSLHFSVPKKGIWSGAEQGGKRSGAHLVQNFVQGMRSQIPEIARAAAEVSSASARFLGHDAAYGKAAPIQQAAPIVNVRVPSQKASTTMNNYSLSMNLDAMSKERFVEEFVSMLYRFDVIRK